jgi:hypothetical protein
MTDAEKLTELQSVTGESDAELLGVYLAGAAEAILNRLYPFAENVVGADVPDRYARVQLRLATNAYMKRGAEGESTHDENGVRRSYFEQDAELATIYPYGDVFGGAQDISSATVYVGDVVWSGEPAIPQVAVVADGATLTLGRDYTLSFRDNDAPGTGTVTVAGIIFWKGSVEATFAIEEP